MDAFSSLLITFFLRGTTERQAYILRLADPCFLNNNSSLANNPRNEHFLGTLLRFGCSTPNFISLSLPAMLLDDRRRPRRRHTTQPTRNTTRFISKYLGSAGHPFFCCCCCCFFPRGLPLPPRHSRLPHCAVSLAPVCQFRSLAGAAAAACWHSCQQSRVAVAAAQILDTQYPCFGQALRSPEPHLSDWHG